jgi:flagellar FliL protein
MATTAKTPDPASSEAAASTKKKPWLLIAAALLALLLIAGAGAWFLLHKEKSDEAHEVQAKPQPPVFITPEPFTVNLQDSRYLQATFTIQIASQAEADHLKAYMPQLRSRLLLLMSSKSSDELSSVDGKNRLLTEIQAMIEQPFASGLSPTTVKNVFITSFVIQ